MTQSIPGSLTNGDPALNVDPGLSITKADTYLGGANTGASNAPGVGIGTGNAGMAPTDGFSEPATPGQFVSDQISGAPIDGSGDGQGRADAADDAVNAPGTAILAQEYSKDGEVTPGDYNDTLHRNTALANIAAGAAEGGIINKSSEVVLAGELYHGTTDVA